MTRAQVERELRERLGTVSLGGGWSRLSWEATEKTCAALLPWLMELVEQVEGETREDCGMLP